MKPSNAKLSEAIATVLKRYDAANHLHQQLMAAFRQYEYRRSVEFVDYVVRSFNQTLVEALAAQRDYA